MSFIRCIGPIGRMSPIRLIPPISEQGSVSVNAEIAVNKWDVCLLA